MESFSPQTAFEGWIYKAIQDIEKKIVSHCQHADEKWNNHLKHHEKLEGNIFKFGAILSGLCLFLGWVARGFVK